MDATVTKLGLLFAAGGLGTLLRYGAGSWARGVGEHTVSDSIHAGTLAVNVLGCLLIGLLVPLLAQATGLREDVKLALLVGLLGGFTTFSTFGIELFTLLDRGQPTRALMYVSVSVIGGLAAVWLGHTLGTRLAPVEGVA